MNKEEIAGLFLKFLEIIKKLRSPEGCPWDREQTHESLRPFIIEEAHEVVDAINRKSAAALAEELGDVLLQIGLHAEIGEESGEFDIKTVLDGINDKLIWRHPHVFSSVILETPAEVVDNWQKIKKSEKKEKQSSFFSDIPESFPQLMYAFKCQEKAARIGFDWDHIGQVKDKVSEEWDELWEEVGENNGSERIEEEFGDLLFALVNLARFLNIHPEEALRKANRKFETRFEQLRKKAGSDEALSEMTLAEMDSLWDSVKIEEKIRKQNFR